MGGGECAHALPPHGLHLPDALRAHPTTAAPHKLDVLRERHAEGSLPTQRSVTKAGVAQGVTRAQVFSFPLSPPETAEN